VQGLLKKIEERSAKVVVIGIGYVGLPLVVEFAKAGFHVTGYDKDREKVRLLGLGESYIGDISTSTLKPLVDAGNLKASSDPDVLGSADCIVVCVPTPLNKTKEPDMRFIASAADEIAAHQHADMLVVLESTTYPGTTREMFAPRMTHGKFEIGKDVFIAYSPERDDPGNKKYFTKNTPKVMGGLDANSLQVAKALYGNIIDTVVPVSSADAAEMVKLLENTFRAVNIGLVNEVAIMCGKLGLDTWEVIQAAASKPFGFMPFYPGPGLGGHCIPIDPLYLSWKLKTLKYNARFISLADEVNSSMPEFVEVMVADALNARRKAVRGSRILVCGVTYKRDIDDVRESPALDIIELLQRRGADVSYTDPYAPTLRIGEHEMKSVPIETAGSYDCVLITTDHRNVDYAVLCDRAQLVVDTRNATRALREKHADKIVSL
jgi:UDP-N-acetyl-D-glucosamine dehydrogenase